MNRRTFCTAAASFLALRAARSPGQSAGVTTAPADLDADPAGGFTLQPPRQFLFADYRHINPGDLRWLAPDGQNLPVAGPPAPPVEAQADPQGVARGIRLVAQKAVRQGPVEGLPGQVIYDGGVYRSWSMRVNYGQGENLGSYSKARVQSLAIEYGESRDGFTWQRRQVGELKAPDVTGIDGQYFFIDPHGPADERYKCIYNARLLSGQADIWQRYQRLHPRYRDSRLGPEYLYCLFGMVSPDGLNWRLLPEPLIAHAGDTDNMVYHDPWLGKYVLYTRLYWMSRRMVARAESEDFRHWGPVEPVLWPRLEDPMSWDVYTNGRSCYPGLPHQHLMFPVFYRRLTQTSEVHLHSSIDGIHWDRVPGGPVLESGEPGTWDSGFLVAGRDLVPLGADRVAIPYRGFDYPHKYPRWPGVITDRTGWAVWPRGRLAGLVAEDEGGFNSFRVEVTGGQLQLNARVSRSGEIRVGLAGIAGRSVAECDPVVGDHLARTVTWKGNAQLGVGPGAGVVLRFHLRCAELFGFEWA